MRAVFFCEFDLKLALGWTYAAWHMWVAAKQQGRATLDKAAHPWPLGKLHS
jgi:hypothetical protein